MLETSLVANHRALVDYANEHDFWYSLEEGRPPEDAMNLLNQRQSEQQLTLEVADGS